jgi:anti-sigma factor RsiW
MDEMDEMDELSCQEVVDALTDHLEGALPPAARAAVEGHLAGCQGCRDYLEQLLATIRLLSLLGGRGSSPGRR